MRWRCVPLVVALVAAVALGTGVLSVEPVAAARAADLETASPSEVGVSAERLERLDAGMQRLVDEGKLAGVVTMLARHGKVVFVDAVGKQDVSAGTPMARDTIFRIYSMTKPITGVAMMMLHEEGKFRLGEPVSKYIPGFGNLKVHVGDRADGSPRLEDADRSMTMAELMSHTGGLGYGLGASNHVDRLYREQGVLNADATLESMVDTLSNLPLLAQPGTRWFYSIGVDVQGYLVEQLSGQSFAEFLDERIFEPLGMVDTAFYVPEAKLDRVAGIYRDGEDGGLAETDMGPTRTSMPAGPSGGGGLWGTADDYLRFAQMMLNGGELDGVRLLSPRTVELMQTNYVTDEARPTMLAGGAGHWSSMPGQGFGLDFAVALDPAATGEPYPKGVYYWGGAAGTWFWIDPVTDLTFVGMIQHLGPAAAHVQGISRNLVYQAVVEP